MSASFRRDHIGVEAKPVATTLAMHDWDDDPMLEVELVGIVGAMRSQPRRRLGPKRRGPHSYANEGMRDG